jgi:hypothetical protein
LNRSKELAMKRLIWAGFALQLCAVAALAQTTVPATQAPAVGHPPTGATTPVTPGSADTVNRTGLVPGANSFTESQARDRLVHNGYDQVSALTKDKDGIWRGSAVKNGSTVRVGVDFKGDVSMD